MNTATHLNYANPFAVIDAEMALIRMRQMFIRELRNFNAEQTAALLLVEENTLAAELYAKLYQREQVDSMLDTHNCVVLSKIPVRVTNSPIYDNVLYINLRLRSPMPFDPAFDGYECDYGDEFGNHVVELLRRSSIAEGDEKGIAGELMTLNALAINAEISPRQWIVKMGECGPVSRQVANRMIDTICTLSVDRKSCKL